MRLPPFSVILVFVVLVVMGAGIMPLLNIQYYPTIREKNMSVNFSWPGASARVVEAEVTSKLEGVISSVSGVGEVRSVSRKGGGSITIKLKSKANIDAVRFELASLIRRVYPKLPPNVSYPYISVSASGGGNQRQILTYTLNAALPTNQIEQYADDYIIKEISLIKGIQSVSLTGASPKYIEVSFEPDEIAKLGISPSDITSAITAYIGKSDIVGSVDGNTIMLTTETGGSSLANIPVRNSNGRIIRLDNITKITYKEKSPESYYRINGLNTIMIGIYPEKSVNTLELCKEVKEKMAQLSKSFPDKFAAIISFDSSIELKSELNKILRRTLFSVIILLLFVFIVSRSIRYLTVIAVTLAANIFIAFIFYYLLDLEIHIYSLAGITVSLGIIIDTSIIMISHYGYYRDRKAFIAILAALLTTMGALAVVFFLPEETKKNLIDFSAVLIINLAVSLAIALIFVPALIDTFPVGGLRKRQSIKARRRVIRFNILYRKYATFGKKHKWIFILLLVLGFGLPVNLLPNKMDEKIKGEEETRKMAVVYNKTIGSPFYQNNLKDIVEKSLGGSLRLFLKNMRGRGLGNREPSRNILSISASMPAGCTVQQLNEIVVYMENYLSQFPQIERFNTRVSSYSSASIEVTFKKEFEYGSFPAMLKSEVISKAIDFGGANWSVNGINDENFNNNVGSYSNKSNRIELTGYNYDLLYKYCREAITSLEQNQRVSGPGVFGQAGWGELMARNEYFIDYDMEKMAQMKINPSDAYNALSSLLVSSSVPGYFDGNESMRMEVVSSRKNDLDVWHLKNEHLNMGGRQVIFSEIGNIEMRQTGNDIYKKNQQYSLTVAYDFIGPYELSSRVNKREVERLNKEVLPLGFKAGSGNPGWFFDNATYFWVLFIIIAIIYLICAILFESIVQPLIIILLIPISFIGLFLTFYFTEFTFDQGGLAALIMLSGISVNAGIYIINQYNIQRKYQHGRRSSLSDFIKAYNHKIIPIMLTILSTVLGLIPFLFDGKNEVFWFAFAVGTMGGLVFSIIGIIFFLPIWRFQDGKTPPQGI
ncbi:MAG: efflux RND transporter permease subunit [Bacteroidales bacterium]|jgi:multidrug efflux pump subunit AcrB